MAEELTERRAHTRVLERVSGHILCHATGRKVALTTHNVSCSGLLSHISHYVPPYTRLVITLELAMSEGSEMLDVEGVVVRIDPEEEEPGCEDYEIAVFFPDLPEMPREHIARFVLEHGPETEGK